LISSGVSRIFNTAIHGGALVSTCAVRGVRCRWSGYPPQSGKTFKCQQQRRSRSCCVSSGRRTPWRAVSDAVEVCDIRGLTPGPVRRLQGTSNRNTESDARQSAPRFPTIYRLAIPVDACTARPGTGVQFPPPPVFLCFLASLSINDKNNKYPLLSAYS